MPLKFRITLDDVRSATRALNLRSLPKEGLEDVERAHKTRAADSFASAAIVEAVQIERAMRAARRVAV